MVNDSGLMSLKGRDETVKINLVKGCNKVGEVQKMLGVSKPTATRLLQKLDVVLELVGHGAGSYYRIRNY